MHWLNLKQSKVVSFASIAPYDNDSVQPYYLALWQKYGHLIDYVNFQFYAYEKGTTISQFITHFETQNTNYKGGKVLVSFDTDGCGGLSPDNGFFEACSKLQRQGKPHEIFIWSADNSKNTGFRYEKQSQTFLASSKWWLSNAGPKKEVMGSSLCGTVATKFISGYCIMAGISIN